MDTVAMRATTAMSATKPLFSHGRRPKIPNAYPIDFGFEG
jgi:hypothetical protein